MNGWPSDWYGRVSGESRYTRVAFLLFTPKALIMQSSAISKRLSLPDELLLAIIQYLNPPRVLALRSIDRRFKDVSEDSRYWSCITNLVLVVPASPSRFFTLLRVEFEDLHRAHRTSGAAFTNGQHCELEIIWKVKEDILQLSKGQKVFACYLRASSRPIQQRRHEKARCTRSPTA